MRLLGALIALAVVAFIVVNIINKPAYYVCSGTKTPHGQPAQPIQRIGLEIEMTPMLNRLVFQSKNAGMLVLEETDVLNVRDDSGDILTITDAEGDFRGQFARITRHLDVFTGYRTINAEYDLYCINTELAPV